LSNDPYFNLSYEEWWARLPLIAVFRLTALSRLFRHTDPALPILFMYRNRESVIIGRNQVYMAIGA
jgi:hypothetical protein